MKGYNLEDVEHVCGRLVSVFTFIDALLIKHHVVESS
jgi:hypothetical protein